MPKYENKERDEALIAIDEAFDMLGGISDASEARDKLLVAMRALRGDEPAKPDRYVVAFKDAKDAYIGPNRTEHESDQAAAAVLRRHFEPSAEVVEWAKATLAANPFHCSMPMTEAARFILKRGA